MPPRAGRSARPSEPLLPFDSGASVSAPRRVFLGWSEPVLHAAARWILADLGTELGDVLVALPGARAALRLRELLAVRAPAGWTPPRVLTQGELIDELVQLAQPAAGRLTRTLVWERALADLEPAELACLQRRASDGAHERLRLAETVRALHGELAVENRDFAALAREAWGPGLEAEARRWQALARAQTRYRERLAQLGQVDPHEGRARAIDAGALERSLRVVLVGVADMNHLLARLVTALGPHVTALVAAPPELAPGFDALGRLATDFWAARDVPLALADWRAAEKPVDEAECVRGVLDEWHGTLAPEELVLGVADESLVPYLERQLADCGVRARRAAGTPLERARPLRLMHALARYLARRGFAELAILARDPDLAATLGRDPDLAARFDRYHREHLPRLTQEWLGAHEFERGVREFHARLEASLGPLASGEPRTLGAWAEPIRAWLACVYPRALDETKEDERVLSAALRRVGAALGELEDVPASLELSALGAADALELLLRVLRGERVPPPGGARASVELVGWLDLPLDDAPAVILTGFNEGKIPQSVGAHAFLPDSRRAALGLPGDAQRLARDVYAATLVLSTRARHVFVSARRSFEGDPLLPSRLAFHRPAAEIPLRVRHFLPEGERDASPSAPAERNEERRHACPVLPWSAPKKVRVTAFRDFLDSPYLFYLRHVLGLETLDDRLAELDPRLFGNLAHGALEDLFDGPSDSTDERVVGEHLVARLRARAAVTFGAAPLPAVGLQLAQLERRLRIFAARQAERAAEGWRIHAVEWKPPTPVVLDVDGEPLELSGKIDRIDRHPDGRWAILDYKTGDRRRAPREAHKKKDGSWSDLQLPLYRHLARALELAGEPALGYVWIAKEEAETGFVCEPFAPAELADALETARHIVRRVRRGDFEEPGRAPTYDEILKAIFGLGTLGGDDEEPAA
ncbi:MAG: PD-(D/E)XK nuclease family protein [Planctomycetes bacterium]|nr:PD-(D/E)XK nuclease family protein [Planctomycetota bacterium]